MILASTVGRHTGMHINGMICAAVQTHRHMDKNAIKFVVLNKQRSKEKLEIPPLISMQYHVEF